MPWQSVVADVAGEYDPATGIPYYRDIIVSVPRQSGKTLVLWAFAVDRCLSPWPGGPRQTVAWTAQTGSDGRKKWVLDLFPMTSESAISAAAKKMLQGMGSETIEWQSGSTISLLATGAGSGHSLSLDLAVIDEAWHDTDDRREQALRPAMATKPAAQMWTVSTMGTMASTAWNRKRDLGRSSVDDDDDSGIAYFEWSCPESEWDPDDSSDWHTFMPALNRTIDVVDLESDIAVMNPVEAKRAYGNITVQDGGDRLIPPELWRRVCDEFTEVGDTNRGFGLAVSEDRSMAAIGVADTDGNIELVEYRAGTKWVAERVDELLDTHGGSVAVDGSGPASSIIAEIDGPVVEIKGNNYVRACQSLFDGITEATIAVRAGDKDLDPAVAGVVRKNVGDSFVWSRRSSGADVAPLEAITLALSAARGDTDVEKTGFVEVMS